MSEFMGVIADDTIIDDLPLKTRTRQALDNCGYRTAGQVRRAGDFELLRCPNIGRRTVDEIRAATGPWIASAEPPPAPTAPTAPPAAPSVDLMPLEEFVRTYISPKFERLGYAIDALASEIRGERAAFFRGIDMVIAAGDAKKKRKKAKKDPQP